MIYGVIRFDLARSGLVRSIVIKSKAFLCPFVWRMLEDYVMEMWFVNENVITFIHLVASHRLNTQIHQQSSHFLRGFQ
ncbi:hypothetical protein L1987_45994 [Smallanthus sonchifolius]|uniref:Uncharacterized protein n=1 Tax=Smallanthus sonchifolius TaxID=185202 RepID=A0ACB9FZH1_9ASTR|nr:hypothetical protein L1987_45994 [Smallanthus sonchifolius]